MAESGIESEEYRSFLEQPSGNMDDSGYFSVQVISSALKVWGLELIPYNSTEPTALMAQNNPSDMNAYICNYKGHWFTIRKLGKQWFNLNSMLSGPQLISDTYLAMYLAQLLQEGYSIFIVIGTLPECPADDVIMRNPITATTRGKGASDSQPKVNSGVGYRLGTREEDDAKILKTALALGEVKVPSSSSRSASASSASASVSRISNKNRTDFTTNADKPRERIIPIRIEGRDERDEEDAELQKALQLSLQESNEDVGKSLNLRLNLDKDKAEQHLPDSVEDTEEDDDLRKALQLSLECMTTPSTPDPDDLRWRRLAFLGIHNSDSTQKLNT